MHGWLSAGTLPGRRSPTGRWCIPFPPDLEAACRARVAASPHLHRDADGVDRHPAELSIAEVAAHLMVNTDVVYYWAERGYLPTRRGKGGRRWVAFTAEPKRPAAPASRTPTSCPKMSKPQTSRKESQYEATIPVIADRAQQQRVRNALEPEWEARLDPKQYGFRPGRGCHDAIEMIHKALATKNAKRDWVLDADLKSAFDKIDHRFLLERVGTFPAREQIRNWLEAGVVDRGRYSPTVEGTPQGGVLTPPTQLAISGVFRPPSRSRGCRRSRCWRCGGPGWSAGW